MGPYIPGLDRGATAPSGRRSMRPVAGGAADLESDIGLRIAGRAEALQLFAHEHQALSRSRRVGHFQSAEARLMRSGCH